MPETAPTQSSRYPRLLESLVLLAIMVSLSGIIVPLVGAEAHSAKIEQAVFEMQSIVTGLRAYAQDTRYLPTGDRGRTNVTWLYGPGSLPGHNNLTTGTGRSMEDVLLNDSMGGPRWQGPYLPDVPIDPWGNAYLVNVDGLVDGREQAFVLSTGPNGRVDTGVADLKAAGDDIRLALN